jgi:hypothetical protein
MIREIVMIIFCCEPPIPGNFCRVLYFMIDPNMQRPGIIHIQRARRMDGDPSTHHFFIRPVLCHIRIEPVLNMQIVIHRAKASNRNCEIGRQQFQPVFNPPFAILKAFSTQKRPPHTSRNAVVITRQAGIHLGVVTEQTMHRFRLGALIFKIITTN